MSDTATRIDRMRSLVQQHEQALSRLRSELVTMEAQRRKEELANLVGLTSGRSAVVVEHGQSSAAGFPTSRSGIHADDSQPVFITGTYGSSDRPTVFVVPSDKKNAPQPTAEGKGPSVIHIC